MNVYTIYLQWTFVNSLLCNLDFIIFTVSENVTYLGICFLYIQNCVTIVS